MNTAIDIKTFYEGMKRLGYHYEKRHDRLYIFEKKCDNKHYVVVLIKYPNTYSFGFRVGLRTLYFKDRIGEFNVGKELYALLNTVARY